MRLVCTKYGLDIKLQENNPLVLCIENPRAFSDSVRELWLQCDGKEGEWILSENESSVSVSKTCDFIINPWSVDCNSKKVITKLYQEIREVLYEKYLDIYGELNSRIVNFLDTVTSDVPYNIDIELEPEFSSLLKLYNVKIENDDVTLIEKLSSYVKIMNRICGTRVFVFVGLKGFLTDQEIAEFYKMAEYEKIFPIILENNYKKVISNEKYYILDSDLCLIEV